MTRMADRLRLSDIRTHASYVSLNRRRNTGRPWAPGRVSGKPTWYRLSRRAYSRTLLYGPMGLPRVGTSRISRDTADSATRVPDFRGEVSGRKNMFRIKYLRV